MVYWYNSIISLIMPQTTLSRHKHPHSYTFEKAQEAVVAIKTLRPMLSPSELETLELLLDIDAMKTIEKSLEEADQGIYEPLEKVIT